MSTHTNTNLISQVQLDKLYDIHDMHAVHTIADLAALGMDTEAAFIFKGTVATYADLPTTGNKIGHVYHVAANHSEYIWAKVDDATTEGWEEFGEHFVVNHTHSIPQLTVTGTNKSSTVSGTAANALTKTAQSDIKVKATASGTAVGANGTASAITAISPTTSNLVTTTVNSASANVTASKVSRTTSKLATTSLKGVSGTASVINSVTPSTSSLDPVSIVGVSGSTTASKATAGTAVAVAKAGTAKSIPNVTGNTSVTASKVSNLAQRSIPNVTANNISDTPILNITVPIFPNILNKGTAANVPNAPPPMLFSPRV